MFIKQTFMIDLFKNDQLNPLGKFYHQQNQHPKTKPTLGKFYPKTKPTKNFYVRVCLRFDVYIGFSIQCLAWFSLLLRPEK